MLVVAPRALPRPRATRMSSRRQPARPRRGTPARTRNVWITLLGAMTVVGGAMLLLDGRPAPAAGGLTLAPLVSVGTVPTLEAVFQTRRAIVAGRWSYIVIHHSGAPAGTPSTIEAQQGARGVKGLGHHFVIGNGRGMEDGELHVGPRWLDQLDGAHAAGQSAATLNRVAISICLVGDGNRQPFTAAQMQRLTQLIGALQDRLGIPVANVILQSDAADVADPGRYFPGSYLRQQLAASR